MTAHAGQRGHASLAVLVVMFVVAAATSAIAFVADEYVWRGRAQAVADACALAAAIDPAAAAVVAGGNGAGLIDVHREADGPVVVVIELHGRRAVAAAVAD